MEKAGIRRSSVLGGERASRLAQYPSHPGFTMRQRETNHGLPEPYTPEYIRDRASISPRHGRGSPTKGTERGDGSPLTSAREPALHDNYLDVRYPSDRSTPREPPKGREMTRASSIKPEMKPERGGRSGVATTVKISPPKSQRYEATPPQAKTRTKRTEEQLRAEHQLPPLASHRGKSKQPQRVGGQKPLTREEERAAKLAAKNARETERKTAAKSQKDAERKPGPMRSLEELREGMRKKASVGQLVSMMDDNQNDKINFDEFKQGIFMCGMRPVPTDKEIELLFRSFDVNRDGTLSYEEVCLGLFVTNSQPTGASTSYLPSTHL